MPSVESSDKNSTVYYDHETTTPCFEHSLRQGILNGRTLLVSIWNTLKKRSVYKLTDLRNYLPNEACVFIKFVVLNVID